MSITIRPAGQADSSGIVRVIRTVFEEYGFTWDSDDYHADLYDIDRWYTAQGHTFYVAERRGDIVGTVALERFPLIPGSRGEVGEIDDFIRVLGTDCSLERLYVHPSARKSGVGSSLVQSVVNMATDEGRQAMELWSDKRFQDAHRLYAKFGATVVGERICHDPDQSPEWGLLIRLGHDPS